MLPTEDGSDLVDARQRSRAWLRAAPDEESIGCNGLADESSVAGGDASSAAAAAAAPRILQNLGRELLVRRPLVEARGIQRAWIGGRGRWGDTKRGHRPHDPGGSCKNGLRRLHAGEVPRRRQVTALLSP